MHIGMRSVQSQITNLHMIWVLGSQCLQAYTLQAQITSLHMVCRYFDPETVGLDFEGMAEDLQAAPEGSIIVLHGALMHSLDLLRLHLLLAMPQY